MSQYELFAYVIFFNYCRLNSINGIFTIIARNFRFQQVDRSQLCGLIEEFKDLLTQEKLSYILDIPEPQEVGDDAIEEEVSIYRM